MAALGNVGNPAEFKTHTQFRPITVPFARRTAHLTPPADAPSAAEPWSAAQWRREWGKVATFIGVLLLLEAANGYLLAAAFAWVLPGSILPGLAALALIVVLIGTVLSRSLMANPALQSHQLRLRITLGGLVALQFAVNTLEGFTVARAHLPASVAQFFQFDPVVAARLIGAALGGSLALITFSYLLLVAKMLEEMLPPPNLQREAEVLLRRYERTASSQPSSPSSPASPPAARQPAPTDATVTVAPAQEETLPATRFWRHLKG